MNSTKNLPDASSTLPAIFLVMRFDKNSKEAQKAKETPEYFMLRPEVEKAFGYGY